MMNILVVDDEILIREVIKEYLIIEGYNVKEATNGLEAIELYKQEKIDLIIMDIMMPKMDGFIAYKEIKKIGNVPCIMLSARCEEYDKLAGFELGIDDYVTKPFSPKELMARVKANLKKINDISNIINCGNVKMNQEAHEVFVDDIEIDLTPKEYDLLKYLMKNKNIALSRDALLSNVWGFDYYGEDRTVDTHIKTLRKRLGKHKSMIKTVREVGYKFEHKEKN
ncbi:MAG: response regulator transcription factor [bacterium]